MVIILVRIVIWLTFFLLIVGEVAAIIWARKFYLYYVRKHRELEERVEAVEHRLHQVER